MGALQQRAGSLEALTLRACDLMDHDPDMPLIFDLRPLALVCVHTLQGLMFLVLLLAKKNFPQYSKRNSHPQ